MTDKDIQQPLMLVMPVELERLDALKTTLQALDVGQLNEALDRVGTVHSSRFVILEDEGWAKLAVVATFDGTVKDYIAAFARELNDQFNVLFKFITDTDDKPSDPVEKDVETFIKYVENRNVLPAGEAYRAYPNLTALDIEETARSRLNPTRSWSATPRSDVRPARTEGLDLDDIQGLILRGYRKDFACHLVLHIDNPGAFRTMLGDLADEDPTSGPFITVAADWTSKPPVAARQCVNIGFTFAGLERLGLPPESLASFPVEFQEGAVERATKEVRDTGPSRPAHWRKSLRSGKAHVIISVYADTPEELTDVTGFISKRAVGAATEIDRLDANRLGDSDAEHFGYTDGLSQPTIEGTPSDWTKRPGWIKDLFPPVPPGEFVLGQLTQRRRPWDPVPSPAELGRNGSFAAFRVMSQDVPAFEEFLTTKSQRVGIGRELLAAKLCGRWRNGEPLVMRPSSAPAATIPRDRLNMFDYEETAAFPESDYDGLLCPHGAHIRRAFPRSQRVIDDFDGFRRRIIRRGMPYGPAYDPHNPSDDERGLVGMFICASLKNQFEYVMRQWLNDGLFTGGCLGRTKDPLTGANDPADSRFVTPGAPRFEATGFPRFVTTRGCAYLFLPSMTALRHIANPP